MTWAMILLFSLNIQNPEMEEFNTCRQYRYGIPQYYQVGTSYEGGLWAIKKIAEREYIVPDKIKIGSGYLTVRFVVNCRGETGLFEIMECDKAFNKIEFDREVKDQILAIAKNLSEWIPGKLQDGTMVDSYKFLTFILKEGLILDIVPK